MVKGVAGSVVGAVGTRPESMLTGWPLPLVLLGGRLLPEEMVPGLQVRRPDGEMPVTLGFLAVVMGRPVPVMVVGLAWPDVKGQGQVPLVCWVLERVVGAVMMEMPAMELRGGEPVSPGVSPVARHNPGDPPPPAPFLPICGPKR